MSDSTKKINKIVKKLSDIKRFKFVLGDENFVIPQQNTCLGLRRFIAIAIYDNDLFMEDENMNKDKIKNDSINYLFQNFEKILLKVSEMFISKYYEGEEFFLDEKKFSDIYPKLFSSVMSKIKKMCTATTDDLFPEAFGYIFSDGEIPTNFLSIINNCKRSEIREGDRFGIYTLTKKLGENSWEAKSGRTKFFLKFYNIKDYFSELIGEQEDEEKINKILKKVIKSPEKIQEHSKEKERRTEFSSISKYITDFVTAEHSSYYEKIYEVFRYIPSNISNIPKDDFSIFLYCFIEFVIKIHKQGIVIGNISPEKILVKVTDDEEEKYEFMIYDLKNTRHVFEKGTYSGTGYDSFFLCEKSRRKLYFYDDIESCFYIFNYLITGRKLSFDSTEEERNSKDSLEFLEPTISKAIRELRILRMEDSDKDSEDLVEDPEGYGKICYSKKKRANNIGRLLFNFRKNIKVRMMEEFFGTKMQKELFEQIFSSISIDPEYSNYTDDMINLMALEQTFKLLYGCEYVQHLEDEKSDEED